MAILYNAPANLTRYVMKQILTDFLWPAIAGLLAALLILDRWVLPVAPARAGPVSYSAAVEAASPAVVNIYTAKLIRQRSNSLLNDRRLNPPGLRPSRRGRVERSLGSGVIMTEQGHILTNNHVIDGADAIQVMLNDGRSANASVVGTDMATDLAVLRVELPGLQAINLGDAEMARVGDVVLAIGNPLGFRHTVSQGIISALGRFGLQSDIYEDYIQTDAAIHLGNSGGALIDSQGRLLGINTLIYTAEGRTRNASTGIGISLAIPVNQALYVMEDLIQYGSVIRGWLGVSAEPVAMNQQGQALLVASVAPDSPAQKAGMQAGDLITHIDNEPVRDARLTSHRIAMLKPGDSVAISVQRERQSLELQAVVGVLNQPR